LQNSPNSPNSQNSQIAQDSQNSQNSQGSHISPVSHQVAAIVSLRPCRAATSGRSFAFRICLLPLFHHWLRLPWLPAILFNLPHHFVREKFSGAKGLEASKGWTPPSSTCSGQVVPPSPKPYDWGQLMLGDKFKHNQGGYICTQSRRFLHACMSVPGSVPISPRS
jgi:hypothetical protein